MNGECVNDSDKSYEKFCLNSALDELHMLATTTKCGLDLEKIFPPKEFLEVKKKDSSKPVPSLPLYVVQMDREFVTKFTISKTTPTSITNCNLSMTEDWELDDIQARRKKRSFWPYCRKPFRRQMQEKVPGVVKTLLTPTENPAADFSEKTTSSSLIVPLPDCGRKSNPSSPVKSQNSSSSIGCSIFRSRSLDDLEISKLNLKDDCHDLVCHGDIDTVSQRISKLHVS